MRHPWAFRLITSIVWALAAASAVYWGLRIAAPVAPLPVGASSLALPPAGTGTEATSANLARWLGDVATAPADPVQLAAASRFVLQGVVTEGRQGVALLAMDGMPARPYRVGSRIDSSTFLVSVRPQFVELGARPEGPAIFRLKTPLSASDADVPAAPPASP